MKSNFYIFLDIDEVLATSYQFNVNPKRWNDEYHRYRFDFKCVKVFNDILEKIRPEINPIIILTSDWKNNYSLEMLNRIFEINEVNCEITNITDNLWGIEFTSVQQVPDCRAAEILKYVKDNQIDNWLVIDDLDLSKWIDDENFVRTPRANEGIKQSGIKEKILKIILK